MKVVGRVLFVDTGLKTLLLLLLAFILVDVVFSGSNRASSAVAGLPEDMLLTGDVEAGTILAEYDPAQQEALTWVLPFRLQDAPANEQGNSPDTSGPSPGQRLMVHIGHKGAQAEQGFYLVGTLGGLEARFTLIDQWRGSAPWSGWQQRSYGWKTANATPLLRFDAQTRMSSERAGHPHELRLQFDFLNDGAGFTRARALIDGHPIRSSGAQVTVTDAQGWFSLPPEFVPAVIRLDHQVDPALATAPLDETSPARWEGSANEQPAAIVQWGRPHLWPDLKDGPWHPTLQPVRVSLPLDQYWLGDSQITGRAAGLTRSNETAFHALWPSFYADSWNTSITPIAKGGRGLHGHMKALQALWGMDTAPREGPEWVHIVETGDQNVPGQHTAKQYGDTFVRFMRWLHQASPRAIVSIETPFSFGRENKLFDEGRDWTQYRLELMARIDQLRKEGITVHLVDNDHRIRALEKKLSPAEVWFQPGTPAQYHFTEVGNLMTALTIYWHLGYDVNAINFQPILDEGLVTQAQIDACLSVLNAPYP